MSTPCYILGISAYFHDSAAALICNGEILSAVQEERFSRKKQDSAFPSNAIRYILEEHGLSLTQLDAVVFYEKPFLKFERIIESCHFFSPRGIKQFLKSVPVWFREKLFLKTDIFNELIKIDSSFDKKNILFSSHHLSHAGSAFYPSPFEEAAILTVDGVGEWATTTIGIGKGNKIEIVKELIFPHSVGLLYSSFTYYCGFKVNSGEYKLMGLAPYGQRDSEQVRLFVSIITSTLVRIFEDGSIQLNMDYFNFATGTTMVVDKKWETLFGFPKKNSTDDITQDHMNLALAIQLVTEDIVIKLCKTAKEITQAKNLVLAGGVALNCVANGKLIKANLFDDVWIQPAAGDAGGSLGAALSVYYLKYNAPRSICLPDSMKGSFLGCQFSDLDIQKTFRKYHAVYTHKVSFDELCDDISTYIQNGKVIGWFQDKMEWGPRALGNRSILANPKDPEMQKKLNLKVKKREGFRPFAPIVLSEYANMYFELEKKSPYMLVTADVVKDCRAPLPKDYENRTLFEKLYVPRSNIPAVTHVDFSARVQTVDETSNKKMRTLLLSCMNKTGVPILINTSFNVRGEPIVCTPEDAYRCFLATDIDILVLQNYILFRENQPLAGNEEFLAYDED